MLRSPKTSNRDGVADILAIIAAANHNMQGERELEYPGFVQVGHFNLNNMLWPRLKFWQEYPEFDFSAKPGSDEMMHCYGVCDSPQQFIERYRQILMDDARTFCVSFTHVYKEPGNAGEGGGWRWHKWGPYIGDGEPTMEYLDDEPGFKDGVYVYHIYQLDGQHLKYNWKTKKLEVNTDPNEEF